MLVDDSTREKPKDAAVAKTDVLPAGETKVPVAKRTKKHPDQPSANKQADIIGVILKAGYPCQTPEIEKLLRLKTPGKLSHNLAWMTKPEVGILVNIAGQGYWPANESIPQ